jgi:hypothetical protein
MAAKKQEEQIDAKEVVILADAVMIRSDALMKSGNISREEADRIALNQVNSARRAKGIDYIKGYVKNKGKGFIIGPNIAATKPRDRSSDVENTGPTNKNSPRPTTPTTTPTNTSTPTPTNTVQPGTGEIQKNYDLQVPGATHRQLQSALEAKLDPNIKMYQILGYGWATKKQRDELIKSLKSRISTYRTVSGTPEFIYESKEEWIKNRARTYVVVLGLKSSEADTKARGEWETSKDVDPFNVLPGGSELPGAAQRQYKAMLKAKKEGDRWRVDGYGLYTDTEFNELKSGIERGFDNGPDSEDPRINPNAGGGGGGGAGGGGGGAGGGRPPKDYGNKKPASAVSGDTYTNSKNVKFTYQNNKWVRTATLGTSGATVVIDGKTVTVGSQQWKTIIQEEFGSMWDVYNNDPEVKTVIDESVRLGYFDDETKMTAKLQNTTWFRTTQQSARQFAIQQSTDPATTEAKITASIEDMRANAGAQGFTLNDMTLRKLATDSLKFGWSDQQKLNALGSEQVAQAQLGGPQGMADLRQSATGRNLRAKAATYFQKPSEELIGTWTQQILTGQKSEVQWDELMRNSARTQFRSLQPALDRGEDVDTAMYAYKQQVAATLGSSIDASQIDWTQDKWNKALNFRDPKTNEYRQMDLWEWNQYLRTLPEWQNTTEAKDAYSGLSMSLARGFGKMA